KAPPRIQLNSLYSRDYHLLKTFRFTLNNAKFLCVALPYTTVTAIFRKLREGCRCSLLRPPAKAGQALRKTSCFGETSLACLAVKYFYRKDARNPQRTQRSEKLTTDNLIYQLINLKRVFYEN
ncbi:MAG: hypothetical protein LBS16_02095, partial [Prevotellaceae bacterium]|nr:hypothetical protein [Prevotellaceae bacterium]